MVPDASLLSAQHIRTGLASLSSQTLFKQAFDSIAGNTVVPYRSLKKFFNYHKLLFMAIYNYFNFMIENYNYDVHLSINLSHALISPSYITETGYLSNTT